LSPPHLPRVGVWGRGLWTTSLNSYPILGMESASIVWHAEIRVTTPKFSGRYESPVVMTRRGRP
jgi:hypothetical protein